ncbi:MAG TPA: zf-HC2 domain-containing protein [Candidatus Methylomirabilis sp.]|jgi:mycothiol system anti-sigma-R factor
MACEEYQDRIYLLQRGELEPAAAGAVRAHLEACAPCRAAYDAEEGLTARLARATRHGAPAGLRERIAAALRAQAAERPSRPWAAWRWRPLAPAAAGAAVAVLLAVPLTWWLVARPPAPILVLVREVAQEHERGEYTAAWARSPGEPEAALAHLSTWMDVGFPKPPMAGGDLTLVSARPAYLLDRKAAAFVYRNTAGRMVTLLVFRGADVQLPERGRVQVDKFKPYFGSADGYTLCVWKQKDVGFSMVGKLSQADLAQAFLNIRRSL